MAFVQKTWKARAGTGLNKYSDGLGNTLTLTNTPDTISQAGDSFTATNMNDLESRIATGFSTLPGVKAGTLTIDGQSAPCVYFKSDTAAMLFFGFNNPATQQVSSLTLPAELQGYDTGKTTFGNLKAFITGNAVTNIALKTVITGSGAGTDLAFINAMQMPYNMAYSGCTMFGSIALTYTV